MFSLDLHFLFVLQRTLLSGNGLKDFRSFHYVGNGKFLVSSHSKNANYSSLWMVDGNTYTRKIFSDIVKNNAHSVAFGCDQGNGSLIVVALKDESVVVKDTKSGVERK